MITYGSTTLTSYNSIVRTEVYYYKSTSATSLSGGSWSTTKPTWENGKYIWQKIRTVYEDGTHTESDPVNITGQQGATGTAAYSYKLNSSDSIIGKTKDGEYTIKKITFSATYKQGTGAVSAYGGRFKIESTTNGSTWKTEYTSSGDESSKAFTIPNDIIAIKCSLYQSSGTTVLLDIITVPVVKDGVDAIGLRDSVPYYLASDKDTGITRLTQGWTRYRPQLTAEKKYLWVYYVSRYSEGTTEPELIEIKDDLVHFVNNGDESPVESCVVDIEPVQAGSGDPSPDNVRPITGWTGAKVTRTGKNLLHLVESEMVSTGWNRRFPISLKAGTYIISCQNQFGASTKGTLVTLTDENDATIIKALTSGYTFGDTVFVGVAATITEEEAKKIKNIRFALRASGTTYNDIVQGNIQLELGSTATDYEPYSGQTYDITFPSEAGTVYGGTLDVNKGELVVDRAIWQKNTATMNNNKDYPGWSNAGVREIVSGNVSISYDDQKMNIGKKFAINTLGTNDILFLAIRDYGKTQTEWQALAIDIQIVIPLATPVTYTLTPQEITMLCKENNIFADTGQTAISYYDNQTSTDPYVDYSLTSAFDASTDALDKAKEVAQDLADLGADLQAQIDSKIETWCQKTDPSTAWTTTELKNQHNGDLWYYTGESTSSYKNNTTYKYTASTNKWTAYSASTDLFDKIDAKASIYYGEPSAITQNLEVGDYLVDSTDGCSYRWDGSKWVKLTDYNAAIDAIEIGGRNLLRGTKTQDTSLGNYKQNATAIDETLFGCTVFTSSLRWADIGFDFKKQILDRNLVKAGDSVTYSIWAKTDDTEPRNIYGVWVGSYYGGTTIAVLSSEWTQYSKTFVVTEEMLEATSAIETRFECNTDCTEGKYIYWAAPKLERGTKATDWTPAPEDTQADIDQAKDLATAVYGTCSTAATTPLKEVVCENFVLFDGVRIQVAFENANSTNVPSINVNNTGAKQILINQATVSESNQLLWAENAQLEFVYDGTYWVLQNAPYSLYGICSVTEEIPEKVIECAEAVICKGTTITVDFMYSNTSDNTVFNVANIAQKPLLVNGDTLKVNSRFNWHAGAVRTFYFDGQAWNMSDDIVSAYIDEYETEQDEDGIMVHPVGQKNTGWSIGSTLELLKNGVSYIKMWFDKVEEGEFSLPFIRIGKESGNHVLVGDDAVTIREDQKELAHYSSLGITFDDETPYKIGNDATYIAFEDTDNDAKADSLRIVADSISFHSNGTEKDLQSELESLTENVDLNAQAIEQNSEIIENTQRYIQINPEVPSIKLATNDRNYLLIESNKLGFWVDANETAYMSQNQMNIPTASITNLLMQTTNAETGETIGQIGWVMRTNGHLSLKIMN